MQLFIATPRTSRFCCVCSARLRGPGPEPIATEAWPGFAAAWQRVGTSASENAVHDSLARLQGYAASATVWLNDLLPSRHPDFADHQLDAAVAEQVVAWAGVGREQITFAPPGEVDLVREPGDGQPRRVVS